MTEQEDEFNRRLITNLANASLHESRTRRRWSIFFRLFFISYLVVVTLAYFSKAPADGDWHEGSTDYAAVIAINGEISAGNENASTAVNSLLRSAFKNENAKGIILEINSLGGSAVESNRIYNEIMRLRTEYPDKKVIAVVGDICASGGYFIASAAEEIYADPASIIGSIGVIFSGFGFVDAIEKLGVERRVQTAGNNKNLLDPFLPQRVEDRLVMEDILNDVHRVFKQAVQNGRGERLADDPRIFTGILFSGSDSVELGLIDGLNDIGGVTRDIIGVDEVLFYGKPDWLESLVKRLGNVMFGSHGVQALAGY